MTMKSIALFALIGTVAAATMLPARADDILECRYRTERVHEKLQIVENRYGKDSAHALKVQRKLEDVHEWCWKRYRGWWNEKEQAWKTEHW